MSKQLSIVLDGEEFIAELLTEKAPKTVEKSLQVLPLEAPCWHSGWLGDTLVLSPDDLPKEKLPYLEPENQDRARSQGRYSVVAGPARAWHTLRRAAAFVHRPQCRRVTLAGRLYTVQPVGADQQPPRCAGSNWHEYGWWHIQSRPSRRRRLARYLNSFIRLIIALAVTQISVRGKFTDWP